MAEGASELTIDQLAQQHRDERPQHPRPPVARAAGAADAPRPHRLLQPGARGAHRADPAPPGRWIQSRADQAAAAQRARLDRGATALLRRPARTVRRRRAAPRRAERTGAAVSHDLARRPAQARATGGHATAGGRPGRGGQPIDVPQRGGVRTLRGTGRRPGGGRGGDAQASRGDRRGISLRLFIDYVWRPFDRPASPRRASTACSRRSSGCGRSVPARSARCSRSRWGT